jgi:hypothetical protein
MAEQIRYYWFVLIAAKELTDYAAHAEHTPADGDKRSADVVPEPNQTPEQTRTLGKNYMSPAGKLENYQEYCAAAGLVQLRALAGFDELASRVAHLRYHQR